MRTSIALLLVLTAALSACSAAQSTPSPSVPAEDPATEPSAEPSFDPAGGIMPADLEPVEVGEALKQTGPVLVEAALIIADGEARLCSIIAESYPPQCGGDTLLLVGFDPEQHLPELELEEANSVQWNSWVQLLGEVDGAAGTMRFDTLPQS